MERGQHPANRETGLVVALMGLYYARRVKRQQLADGIEANSLYGGRVS